jgi:hypothetical protein
LAPALKARPSEAYNDKHLLEPTYGEGRSRNISEWLPIVPAEDALSGLRLLGFQGENSNGTVQNL